MKIKKKRSSMINLRLSIDLALIMIKMTIFLVEKIRRVDWIMTKKLKTSMMI